MAAKTDSQAPAADGTTTDWTPVGSGSDHKDRLASASDDDRIECDTDGLEDFVTITDLTMPNAVTTINKVTVKTRCRDNNNADSRISAVAKKGGDTLVGDAINYRSSWQDEEMEFTTKPGGGAWTVDDINSTEFGVRAGIVNGGLSIDCSKIEVDIEWTTHVRPMGEEG